MLLFRLFRKRIANTRTNNKLPYPLEELSRSLNHPITVYYTNADVPRISKTNLITHPTEDAFYIGPHRLSFHIVYWNIRHFDGGRSTVKQIEDSEGNIIYLNQELPFDFSAAREVKYL